MRVMYMDVKVMGAIERLKQLDSNKLQELLKADRDYLRNRRWEIEKAEMRAMEVLRGVWLK